MKKILLFGLLALAFYNPALTQDTLTIFPDKDAQLIYTTRPGYTYYQTTNYATYPYYRTEEWTSSGYPLKMKALMGVDLSELPSTAVIKEAKLYLYGTGNHVTDITTGNSSYKSNATYLQRVTSSWDESTVTWNTSLTIDTTNKVTLPNSTTSDEDYVADVTKLIKDIQLNPTTSDGILFTLVSPLAYTEMRLASSDYADSDLHPKLEILYEIGHFSDTEGFENADTKWKDTNGDDIDWTRNSGSTPSLYTGPSGAIEGQFYAHIEASSNENKEAYLLSPEYYFPDTDKAQVSFNYHMYGANIATLKLEVSTNRGSNWTQIWSQSGNQGDIWKTASVDLSDKTGGVVQLRFIGKTGTTFYSDIAIDKINVSCSESLDLSDDQNYTYTITPMTEYGPNAQKQSNIKYFDGLGRVYQGVNALNSPQGRDMVTPIEYDDFGRMEKKYLSFSADDDVSGGFRDYEATGDDVMDMQESFFQDHFSLGTNDPYAYSTTVFEESPINRVLEQGSAGEVWQPIEEKGGSTENVVEYDYGTNSSSEVRYYYVNGSGVLTGGTSYYQADTIVKSTVLDEDGNKTEEFKDILGRVVLKRNWDGATKFSTYYVYDDFGLLRYVLPPKADGDGGLPTSTEQADLCYKYIYDKRQRLIEKKLPGAESIYMVYDKRDRVVATQDGNMRNGIGISDDEWLITKYDHLNRPVLTALYLKGVSRSSLQTTVDLITDFEEEYVGNTASDINGYNNSSWPSDMAASDVLTATYYDKYDFLSLTGFTGLSFNNTDNIDTYYDNDGTSNGYFDVVRGQVTGTSALVLDGASNWVHSVNYFDKKYRVIQSRIATYPEGNTVISNQFDFVGNLLMSLELQDVNSVESQILYRHEYDHAGRLIETYANYDNQGEVLLAQNRYNELGELIEKNLHSTNHSSFTQSVNYSYNIRGWLTDINNPGNIFHDGDYFGMSLFYDESSGMGNTALYNGNISAISWNRSGSNPYRGYAFEYDDLNRIESADYKEFSLATWTNYTKYETEYTYDSNGNISNLLRYDASGILKDDLDYDYSGGNQLQSVTDGEDSNLYNDRSSGGFSYDLNGNMTVHEDQRVAVDYNYLNLPEKVQTQISPGTDKIEYIYDANGVKWLKKATISSSLTKTMYSGSMVFEDDDSNGYDLQYIISSEGTIQTGGASTEYHYFIKDHLGNTRVTFDDTGTKLQEIDYYPFGMKFPGTLGGENKYLYNGKELQDEQLGGVNLDWYDYGARYYDPALGRFHTIDPLAETYNFQSPFAYAANNPVLFTDYLGLGPEEEGKEEEKKKKEKQETDDQSRPPLQVEQTNNDATHVDFVGDLQIASEGDDTNPAPPTCADILKELEIDISLDLGGGFTISKSGLSVDGVTLLSGEDMQFDVGFMGIGKSSNTISQIETFTLLNGKERPYLAKYTVETAYAKMGLVIQEVCRVMNAFGEEASIQRNTGGRISPPSRGIGVEAKVTYPETLK